MPTPNYGNINNKEDDQKISHPPNSGPRKTQEEEKALCFGTFPEHRIKSSSIINNFCQNVQECCFKKYCNFSVSGSRQMLLAKTDVFGFKRSTLNKEK